VLCDSKTKYKINAAIVELARWRKRKFEGHVE
jgi:hypothetical protein